MTLRGDHATLRSVPAELRMIDPPRPSANRALTQLAKRMAPTAHRLRCLALLVSALSLLGGCGPDDTRERSSADDATSPPNLIVVLLDDVGMDKLGFTGEHPDAPHTPTMNRLAAEGVSFPNTWVNPTCSPTRVSILTGRYGFRTGIGTSMSGPKEPSGDFSPLAEERTLPELLRPARYRSWAVGKWHAGSQRAPGGVAHRSPITWGGFEAHVGALNNLPGGTHDDEAWYAWPQNSADADGYEVTTSRTYTTTATVDTALEFIAASDDAPFFLWLAFHAPHRPWHAPPDELHGQGELCEGDCGPRAKYDASLEALDTELGRMLASIPASTLERTTVIVLGDNGTPRPAIAPPFVRSQGHKGWIREGGINVPLLVWGAQVRNPGRVSAELINGVDLFPTLVELGGVSTPDDGVPRDGHSFLPVLRDEAGFEGRTWVYSEQFVPNGIEVPRNLLERTVRNKAGWKLEQRPLVRAESVWHLVHLPSDPLESTNLYPPQSPEASAAFEELRAVLEELHG